MDMQFFVYIKSCVCMVASQNVLQLLFIRKIQRQTFTVHGIYLGLFAGCDRRLTRFYESKNMKSIRSL